MKTDEIHSNNKIKKKEKVQKERSPKGGARKKTINNTTGHPLPFGLVLLFVIGSGKSGYGRFPVR
jgi:hypothetical protein